MANKPRKRSGGNSTSETPESQDDTPTSELGELPLDALRRFRLAHDMDASEPMTPAGFMLQSEVGSHTWTSKHSERVPAREVLPQVKDKIRQESVQEGEAIAAFLYTIKHKNSVLKTDFMARDMGSQEDASP